MHIVICRLLCIALIGLLCYKLSFAPSDKAIERYKRSFWCIDDNILPLKILKVTLSLLISVLPASFLSVIMVKASDQAKQLKNGIIWICSEPVRDLTMAIALCILVSLISDAEFPIFLPARLWILDGMAIKKKRKKGLLAKAVSLTLVIQIIMLIPLSYFFSTRFEKNRVIVTNDAYIAKELLYSDLILKTDYGFSPDDNHFFVYLDLHTADGMRIDFVELCDNDEQLIAEVYAMMRNNGARIQKKNISEQDYNKAKELSNDEKDDLIDELFEVVSNTDKTIRIKK